MTTMMIPTTRELYPPVPTAEWWKFMRAVATDDRDERGNFVLRHHLTPTERRSLEARAAVLVPWLSPGKESQIKQAVIEMMVGFAASPMTRDQAAVKATQYVAVLKEIPVWAVVRACGRFARGEVKAEEINAKSLDPSFMPSTAQLRMVAIDLMRPFGEESTRISMTLRGTVHTVVSDGERAKVGEALSGFAAEMKRNSEQQEQVRRDEIRKLMRFGDNKKAMLEQYEISSVDPVYDSAGTLLSLSLMQSVGWTIRKGYRTLVPPPQPQRDGAVPRVTEGT